MITQPLKGPLKPLLVNYHPDRHFTYIKLTEVIVLMSAAKQLKIPNEYFNDNAFSPDSNFEEGTEVPLQPDEPEKPWPEHRAVYGMAKPLLEELIGAPDKRATRKSLEDINTVLKEINKRNGLDEGTFLINIDTFIGIFQNYHEAVSRLGDRGLQERERVIYDGIKNNTDGELEQRTDNYTSKDYVWKWSMADRKITKVPRSSANGEAARDTTDGTPTNANSSEEEANTTSTDGLNEPTQESDFPMGGSNEDPSPEGETGTTGGSNAEGEARGSQGAEPDTELPDFPFEEEELPEGYTDCGKVLHVMKAGGGRDGRRGRRVIVNYGTDKFPLYEIYPGSHFGRGTAEDWEETFNISPPERFAQDYRSNQIVLKGRVQVQSMKKDLKHDPATFFIVAEKNGGRQFVVSKSQLKPVKGCNTEDAKLTKSARKIYDFITKCIDRGLDPDTRKRITPKEMYARYPWFESHAERGPPRLPVHVPGRMPEDARI